MKMTWDEKYVIGNARIDSEHQIFLDLISSFSDRVDHGASIEELSRTLLEIEKYADFHFTSEENMMEDCAYPQRAHHAQLHARLLSSLRNKRINLISEGSSAQTVFEFLFQWFALHTSQEDKKLAKYLRQADVFLTGL
jgi:hemerythrin